MNKIVFGQQPCGIFPKRFLWSKILTAKRLAQDLGEAEIVFFYHDSDHDYRETQTLLEDRATGAEECLNFSWLSKIQKKYVPLYKKRVCPQWKEETLRRLPRFVNEEAVKLFQALSSQYVADFCLEYYRALGLLDGIQVLRSSAPELREAAPLVSDYFVDVEYEGEIVRARQSPSGPVLHRGGGRFIQLPNLSFGKSQVSPARDTRLFWMQEVLQCSHYVAGASEIQYMDCSQAPGVVFVERDFISDSHQAFVPELFLAQSETQIGEK